MRVLFLRVVEMLILDFGVEDTYCLATDWGLGIPPPTILTDVVLIPLYFVPFTIFD